jgi:elongation factor Ts
MTITANQVKELRDRTGAGFMDCKKALAENAGDVEAAIEYLRKQGIAKAAKRAGRQANEGVVEAYQHPGGRVGVMLELNCETDFVARTEDFQALAKNLALQVAAMRPIAVTVEELPEDVVAKEREIYRDQALASGKPENVVEKIIDGKMGKFYEESVLLEQPYVKDGDKKVKDLVQEVSAKVGENVTVRRFSRFEIGES